MKFIASILFGSVLLFSACDKKESVIQAAAGTMRVSGSSSACTVYIQLDAGKNIYPVNHDKVEPFLTDGKRVTVDYRPTSEFVSPCPDASSAIIENIR